MRYQIISAIIGCALLLPGVTSGQQRLDPNLPGRTAGAGLGIRDAGDLGTVWLAAVGVRIPVARRVNGGLTASYATVPARECPSVPVALCGGDGRMTGLDLDLEFYYGGGVIHPYGVVSLGIAHLNLADDGISRPAFSYSTGLGVGGCAGARAWVFLEGRWRQERFGDISAHGLVGMAGAKFGF